MKKYLLMLVLLAGCAAQEEQAGGSTQDVGQAVRDFIELRQLESLDSLRSGTNDGWTEINLEFVLYTGRRDTYLVEFVRPCYELRDNTRITPDKRWDSNTVRARFDTLRGCRIARIYALDEAEVAELKNIGEAPGSRN
jgi:hypothetical protein